MDAPLRGTVTFLRRRARTIAVVGAVVAVGAATLMTVAVAEAAEPGRCVGNVNVRAEPDQDAPVLTVCRRGTPVTVGEIRNGFVELTSLHGWAAQEYVEINGHTPRPPVERIPAADEEPEARPAPRTARSAATRAAGPTTPATTPPTPEQEPAEEPEAAPEPAPVTTGAQPLLTPPRLRLSGG
ncbi:SH3 domain-containing protein [Pseudonocardia thermophila]|jgi:Predicted membrane protein|uniref:SH3 domain-containing protein n=1 Tax=Pseudonocardia thermophila TaxID=1848 RepID=A0A1M6NB90_PSETH|nr:SH3 domain-containing protein [Pseudonocardia thermophila]SHJ92971.1 SH3 domain-containing protein [Pseudonocardia thermophila]